MNSSDARIGVFRKKGNMIKIRSGSFDPKVLLVVGLLALVALGVFFYLRGGETQRYVYINSDPDDISGRYRVVADITDGNDNDGQWSVDKVYFDDGNTLTLKSCSFEKNEMKGECTDAKTSQKWYLEITDDEV